MKAATMPHITSPAEYVSSESQCDPNLTSDTDQSPSEGHMFPAWHRARHMNSYSDAALCQKLSQLRAYSAFTGTICCRSFHVLLPSVAKRAT
ncbi:unnamed protein product [Ectocarpus sp. 6 AP-2014]